MFMMDRACSPSLVRPALPLRRPTSSPSFVTPRSPSPAINNQATQLPQERSLFTGSSDALKAESRNESGWKPVRDNSARTGPISPSLTVNWCNYCSKQGKYRCAHCKKTYYCSVTCQTEDWKAHRHLCKLSAPENSESDQRKESLIIPCADGASVLESKVITSHVVEPKRVYLGDLPKNNLSKGNEIQAYVVEMRTPGKFFIHVQSVKMSETLKSISLNLQKTYCASLASVYKPEIGEICAVKFSFDQIWYRGEIESVDLDRHTAKVLYIDFGNEEDVKFDQIRLLSTNIDAAPPCALQCCIAGVTAVASSWTDECCIALRQLVAGKNLTFTVVDVLNSNAVFAVDAPLSTLGKNLSTFLIDQGYAMKENPSTKPQIKEDLNSLMIASFENFKHLSEGKNENTDSQPPEPLNQRVGDIFTAIVTHIQSPTEIICQKQENASIIQQLQKDLREHCTKTRASENFRPAPGTLCCSLFSEDNQWYRAKVLAYSSENRVCVGYVDFGNSEEVLLNQLRPVNMTLLALATQAIPCALAGIKPTSDVWLEETVVILKRLVCNRLIRVEILGEQGGTALVSMVDESSDPQTNVAELLVVTGHATVGNVEMNEGDSVESLDKLEWSCAELPIDGQKMVLVVSVLENPGQFYCYNYNAEDMQTLGELSIALTKHCESDGTPFNPAVGEPCCALFTDGSWYRGMVQSLEEDGNAKVYFVDYGNTCKVQTAHLRAIKPTLLKHPFQAICCWIAGLEPVGEEWSKDAVQKFQTLCVGKQLMGRVLSVTEKGYGVELEYSGCIIADILIAEQLAKPSRQENMPVSQAAMFSELVEAHPALVSAERPSHTDQPAKIPGQKPAASKSSTSTALFPLDWKTVELPRSKTFQPQVAAVTSPSLFYVMNPREVEMEKLQSIMADVTRYCSKQTLSNQAMPLPGAACCAQFSGDRNWYRAVVLETTSTSASVIYADYGNTERVPVSSLLPIPKALLQHPFQIARCALAGKENFPTVWPPEVLELFGVQLRGKVLASVDDFDGTFNLLDVTQHSAQGDGNINSIILGGLKKSPWKSCTTTLVQEAQGHGQAQAGSTGSTSTHNLPAETGEPKPQSHERENMKKAIASMEKEDLQTLPNSVVAGNAPASCCCVFLEQKIAHIEELLLLLVKQMGGGRN